MDNSHSSPTQAWLPVVDEVWAVPGYDVEELLGFGATGEVWRAREVASGEVVALKRLRPGADPVAVELLRREATLLRRLDTPYVVRLRAVVGDVLVLDHAPGGSLAALLVRRGALDPGEVVTVAAPLASALAVAHGLGMVHGDVSPANVLFTAEGMPLLADLGVARVPGEDRAGVDGTAEYLDPVVAAGGEPDAASDVWALAAVCHHLLAGTPPHDGVSAEDVLDAARAGGRAPLGLLAPSVPRALVAAVEAGLASNPAARPDAAAFCSLLRRAHAAAPVRMTGGAQSYAPVRDTHVVRRPPALEQGRSWRSRLTGQAPVGRLPVGQLLVGRSPVGQPPVGRLPVGRRRPVRRDGSGRSPGGHAAGAAPRSRLPAAAGPVLALVVAVLLAAGVGWASGRSGVAGATVVAPISPPAAPADDAPADDAPAVAAPALGAPADDAPQPTPAAPPARGLPVDAASAAVHWAGVLDELDGTRAGAFERSEPAALQGVWAPGSAGLAADTALVRGLAAVGQRAVGLRHVLREVRVVQASATSARLRVVDVLGAHEVRTRDGTVVRRVAERGSTAWAVSLLRVDGSWRLRAVDAV